MEVVPENRTGCQGVFRRLMEGYAMSARRRFSGELKALEALRGGKTIQEIAAQDPPEPGERLEAAGGGVDEGGVLERGGADASRRGAFAASSSAALGTRACRGASTDTACAWAGRRAWPPQGRHWLRCSSQDAGNRRPYRDATRRGNSRNRAQWRDCATAFEDGFSTEALSRPAAAVVP